MSVKKSKLSSPSVQKDVFSSQTPMRGLVVAATLLGLIVLFRFLDSVKQRWYMFEPRYMHELAQTAIKASPKDDMQSIVHHIVSNLTTEYADAPISINSKFEDPSEWVFNNAGGAMGAMFIIHASITEYLIVFGTPLGTEGHSGLHTADDYFNILIGEQWAFAPGSFQKEVYRAGSVHHLPRGNTKQYKMHEGCFALEYAVGWIPPMMPFGFADSLTSTLDIPAIYHTIRITGREMIKNLLLGKI